MHTTRRSHRSHAARFAIVLFIFAASAWGAEGVFHVAPNGNDANAGTKNKPFATLATPRVPANPPASSCMAAAISSTRRSTWTPPIPASPSKPRSAKRLCY